MRRRRRYVPVPQILGEIFGGMLDEFGVDDAIHNKEMISSTEEGDLVIEFRWPEDGPSIKHYPNDDEIAQLQAALARHLGERLKATIEQDEPEEPPAASD